MGTIYHDAVLVTSCGDDDYLAVTKYLDGLESRERCMFALSLKVTNSFFTVVMFPDGSKAGWGFSDDFDIVRQKFINFAKSLDCAQIMHVMYGERTPTLKANVASEDDEVEDDALL